MAPDEVDDEVLVLDSPLPEVLAGAVAGSDADVEVEDEPDPPVPDEDERESVR